MKLRLCAAVASAALCAFATSSAFAVDYDYFKGQSCSELGKELSALQKAEKEVSDKKKDANSKANTQAVITTLLVGWPFWGETDHGDAKAL
jgi:hypothetical protein